MPEKFEKKIVFNFWPLENTALTGKKQHSVILTYSCKEKFRKVGGRGVFIPCRKQIQNNKGMEGQGHESTGLKTPPRLGSGEGGEIERSSIS